MNPTPSVIRTRKIAAGTGKANYELSRFAAGKGKTKDITLIVISRDEVENGDLTRFLGSCSPKHQDHRLAMLHGKVRFTIDGFDDDLAPLCIIPSVRNFFRFCHERWPCWSFFADLESDCLAMIAACVVPHLICVQRPRHKVEVTTIQHDLVAFFEDGLPAVSYLHSRLCIDKKSGAELLHRVYRYLEIPGLND